MRRNTVTLLMLHAARALRCAPLRTRRTLALVTRQAQIYDAPTLYDAAFGFRDFEDEVDFLCAAHERHGRTGGAPVKILELAAGPARHAVEAASRGMEVKAVDLSEAMAAHGARIATENDVALDYRVGDVREPLPFDKVCSAWLLLGSVGHLLTNDDALRCFQNARKALADGGTLILELPHPRETFRLDGVSEDGWEVPFEGSDLRVRWGAEDDAFDPLTQIRQASVAFETAGTSINDVVPTREYTLQELRLLADAAGFVDVATYGALDAAFIPADDDELAYRLVVVLTA
jgi:SAM-dependent methyltransferase